MVESAIEKRAKRIKQRRESALSAFQSYVSRNAETLLQIPNADPEYMADLFGRLYPKETLPKIRARLRSAGINRKQFGDAVGVVLDQSNDKMIQPKTKRLIASRLWIIFSRN